MSTDTARLTQGSVTGHLVKMALPMLGGIFATMSFNVADTYFVGQLGGRELAAMSFTFPVIMVLMAAAIGLGAGASSVIARAIGASDPQRTRRLTTDALLLTVLVAIVLGVLGIATIDSVFSLLGAPQDMLPLISRYMLIWYAGTILFLVPFVGMGAIRATGDTRVPMIIMISGAVINIVLDPLLIFGIGPFPRLELEGAALASLSARFVIFVAAIWVLHFRLKMIDTTPHPRATVFASWRAILHVGLPAAGTNAIIPLCTAVVTAMLATYGAQAVAGFGVASRVEALTLIVFYAMSSIIGPFMGQNLSAGKYDRMLEALRICAIFCMQLGLVLAALMWWLGRDVAALFNEQPQILTVATSYLMIVPISYGAAGIVMTVNAGFNGMGTPLPAVVISTLRMAVIYLPLAWLGAWLYGFAGIFMAYACANLVCGAFAYWWIRKRVQALVIPQR